MTRNRATLAVAVTAVAVGVIAVFLLTVPPYPLLAYAIASIPAGIIDRWWYSLAEPRSSRLYDEFQALGYAIYPFAVALAFWLWSRPLRRSDGWFPRRTQVLGLVGLALSGLWYVMGWGGGLEYQGRSALLYYVTANLVSFGCLVALWRVAKQRNSWWGSLAAHAGLFLWFASIAFPWLGEMI